MEDKIIESFKIPEINYLLDNQGKQSIVQLKVEEWEKFVQDFKAMHEMIGLKSRLKNAFLEVKQIEKQKQKATKLKDFLNEL